MGRPTGIFGAAGSAVSSKNYRVGAVKSIAFCDEVRGSFVCHDVFSCCSIQDALCWNTGTHPSLTEFSRPLHEWIAIVCEFRVFLYDYMTHKVLFCCSSKSPPPGLTCILLQVCDFSTEEALRKSASVNAVARISSDRLALGCSDGECPCMLTHPLHAARRFLHSSRRPQGMASQW